MTGPRAVLAVVVAAGSVYASCTVAPEELPEIARPSTRKSACTADQEGIPDAEVVTLAVPFAQCLPVALAEGCQGNVRFDVDVDEFGRGAVAAMHGHLGVRLRRCIEVAVRDDGVFGPATDCRGRLVRGKTSGSYVWDASMSHVIMQLANITAVGTAWSPACPTSSRARNRHYGQS